MNARRPKPSTDRTRTVTERTRVYELDEDTLVRLLGFDPVKVESMIETTSGDELLLTITTRKTEAAPTVDAIDAQRSTDDF